MPTPDNGDVAGYDLTGRLRHGARPAGGGHPSWPAPAASAPVPAGWGPASGGPPPAPLGAGPGRAAAPAAAGAGGKPVAIILGVAGGIAALVMLSVVAMALLGNRAEDGVTGGPPALGGDAPAGGVFAPIPGYTYAAAPQSDIDKFRDGVVAHAEPGAVGSADGRIVKKGGRGVAAVFMVRFVPDAVIDADAGFDAIAANLDTSKRTTVAGADALSGQAGATHIVVVYKDGTGLVVTGASRSATDDLAAKVARNI